MLYATSDRLAGLQAQLEALSTPEVGRLQAAERRERELCTRHDELLTRVAALPEPSRLPWARDPHAGERANLDQALAGVQAELHAVQTLRSRLERETGDLDAIRSDRVRLERAIADGRDEFARGRRKLVEQTLAEPPSWVTAALGERPISGVRLSQQWERAVSEAVTYRLEQRIENEPTLLGERPADPDAARRYDAAARTVEQAQQRLGVDRREPSREVSSDRLMVLLALMLKSCCLLGRLLVELRDRVPARFAERGELLMVQAIDSC